MTTKQIKLLSLFICVLLTTCYQNNNALAREFLISKKISFSNFQKTSQAVQKSNLSNRTTPKSDSSYFFISEPEKIIANTIQSISLDMNIKEQLENSNNVIEIQLTEYGRKKAGPWLEIDQLKDLNKSQNLTKNYLRNINSGNILRARLRTKQKSQTIPLLITFNLTEQRDISLAASKKQNDKIKPNRTTSSIKDTVDIIERNEWGARKSKNDYSPHEIDSIIIHHSWSPDQESYHEANTIAGIQNFHMDTRGWDDVGYHYLVGPDGLIFRGRPELVSGAHCVPNHGKLGICLIGNYDPRFDPLPKEGWKALKELTIAISSKYDVPPDRLYGHRDFSHKSCPGEAVYEKFPELKSMFPFASPTKTPITCHKPHSHLTD